MGGQEPLWSEVMRPEDRGLITDLKANFLVVVGKNKRLLKKLCFK